MFGRVLFTSHRYTPPSVVFRLRLRSGYSCWAEFKLFHLAVQGLEKTDIWVITLLHSKSGCSNESSVILYLELFQFGQLC